MALFTIPVFCRKIDSVVEFLCLKLKLRFVPEPFYSFLKFPKMPT